MSSGELTRGSGTAERMRNLESRSPKHVITTLTAKSDFLPSSVLPTDAVERLLRQMITPRLAVSLLLALSMCGSMVRGQQASGFGDASVVAPQGLIGWWPGDGTTRDLTGTADGNPTSIAYASGIVGQAFRFIGPHSLVVIPTREVFRSLTNLTFECWVRNDPVHPFRRLMTLTPDHVILGIDQGGNLFLTVRFGDLAATPTGQAFHDVTIVAGEPVPSSEWTHVAGTYDGDMVRLYRNGLLIGSKAAPGKLESRGAASEVYINYLKTGEIGGLIDEPALYNRALSLAEVQSHFAAGALGMVKAPTIAAIGLFFPGDARLRIRGVPNRSVTIQSSTNLLSWTHLVTLENRTGNLSYTDDSAGDFDIRFLRALGE